MKIIILAAGKGERLMPLTRNTPKPLLDMGNGYTLIEEQIRRITQSGVIDEIVLVIGYLAEQIEAKARLLVESGIRIKTIFNPFFDVSNNFVSLWLARHELDGDFIITNGDNIFAPQIFENLVGQNKNGVFLAVCEKEQYDEDDMKVTIRDGEVARVHKTIPLSECHAESPGLVLAQGPKAIKLFKDNLDALMRKESSKSVFWLELFNVMHEKGIAVLPFKFEKEWKWQEVDFHLDVNKARELIKLKT